MCGSGRSPLELQPNFPRLVGSQKGKLFLSGLLATKRNSLYQALVPVDLRTAVGFNHLLLKGALKLLYRSKQSFAGKDDHLCLS